MVRIFLLGAAFMAASPAFAAGAVLGRPARHIHFEQLPPEATLIGGEEVSREQFPGVFYTSQGSSRCTGTAVASKVIASAAHCMANGGSLTLSYAGKTYRGTCKHHPDYRRNSTADWALCTLTEPLPDPVAESLNQAAERVKVGAQLRLMGYGCVRQGGGGGNDGKLRTGFAPVTRLPRDAQKDYDIITKGSVALCFGDSGGPAFVEESGRRWVTSVNSRGDIRTTSYLPSWSSSAAQAFLSTFPVPVCGVHEGAEGCRGQATPPPLPAECRDLDGHVKVWSECLAKEPKPERVKCDDAVDAMQACYEARYGEAFGVIRRPQR